MFYLIDQSYTLELKYACEAMHPPKPNEKTNQQVEKQKKTKKKGGYIGWKRPGTIAILGATDSNVD